MYISRDLTTRLIENQITAHVVVGPRQCGKSTLLSHISKHTNHDILEVTFDDLQLRALANRDPALFFEQFPPPIILDEIQYVPNIFTEIKLRIDQLKQQRLQTGEKIPILFRMTGSNQLLMDKNIKETLVGRASYFYLNTLTVHEIKHAFGKVDISEFMFRGGWPELYIEQHLSPVKYLNDYIRSYIEKDVVLTAGVQKQEAFNSFISLLAARTGNLVDYSNLARDTGIQAVTIKEWVGILQRASIVYCLKPFSSNLNKRLTKTPKIYFLDTGLAVRLQGWQERTALIASPQSGALFETLVFAEIFKFIQNYEKSWQIYLWRTKEGDEIDFIIITETKKVIALDAKMSIQSRQPIKLSASFKKMFPQVKFVVSVTFCGKKMQLSSECLAVPIADLHDFLTEV